MPLYRAREPAAERPVVRETKVEEGTRVVDPPARGNHHQDRECVDPVRESYEERVNPDVLGHGASGVHGSHESADTAFSRVERPIITGLTGGRRARGERTRAPRCYDRY